MTPKGVVITKVPVLGIFACAKSRTGGCEDVVDEDVGVMQQRALGRRTEPDSKLVATDLSPSFVFCDVELVFMSFRTHLSLALMSC